DKELKVTPLIPPADFDAIASNYTGRYQQMNYPHNTFEKVAQLFGFFADEQKVSHDTTGRLTIFGRPYIQIEDNLFQSDNSSSTHKVEFQIGLSGKANRLVSGTSSYRAIPWYQQKRLRQIPMLISILALLFATFRRPLVFFFQKQKHQRAKDWRYEWQYWTGACFVLGAIGLITIFLVLQDQVSDYGIPWSLNGVLALNTLGALSTLIAPWALYRVWTDRDLHRRGRIVNSLLILALIITAALLAEVNMVGFQYY
ncbi:MAG: hypothetical protein HKN16_08850, partial [Saprospiraceae bacterium]|nr:hypothetical protein [Saprospiraceae bacterium]